MPPPLSKAPSSPLIISTNNGTSTIPPAPPLPKPSIPKPACENIQIKTLQDIQGRAKTVRIGKVRWPPPLNESETFENELQRRLALQRKIQEEISVLNAALDKTGLKGGVCNQQNENIGMEMLIKENVNKNKNF